MVAVLTGEEDTARMEVLQVILEILRELKFLVAMLAFVYLSLLPVADSLVCFEVGVTGSREITFITGVERSPVIHLRGCIIITRLSQNYLIIN